MEEVVDNNNYLSSVGTMSGSPGRQNYHALPLHYRGHNTATAMPGRFPNLHVQSASNLPPVAEDLAITGQVLAGNLALEEIQVDDTLVLDSTPSGLSDAMLYSANIKPGPFIQDTLSRYIKQGVSAHYPPPYGQPSMYTGYPPGSINYTMPHPTGPGAVSCCMSQQSRGSYPLSYPSSPGNISYPIMSHTAGLYMMQNELTSSSQSESRYSSPSLQPNVVGISTPTQNIVRTSASDYMFTPNPSDATTVIRTQPLSVSDVVAASLSLSSLRSPSSPWQHAVPKRMPWIATLCTTSPPVFSGAALNSQPDSTSCYTRRLKRPSTEPLLATNHKQRVNEEMMAVRMRQLRISPLMNSEEQNTPSLQRWIEVENRLMDEDLEEHEDEQESSTHIVSATTPSGPTLHLASDINLELLKPSPVLPPDLVQAIVNPSMQIVLWKPPGTFIKEVASDMLNDKSSEDEDASELTRAKNILRSGSSVVQYNGSLPDIISSSAVVDPVSPVNPADVALPDDDWDDDMEL